MTTPATRLRRTVSSEWWRWSYGDRYWALAAGAAAALYGPVSRS
jgi:hypothetical protein